jgi:hypothetical protein
MSHGCHECHTPNGCVCERPVDTISLLTQAVNADPEVVTSSQEVQQLEKALSTARRDLARRRQVAETRHRARLDIEAKKKEIAVLEATYASTLDHSFDGMP